jgi:hypothetical protein
MYPPGTALFYLDAEVSEKVGDVAAKPGSSKTAIMTDALKAYFDRAASTELDERFEARLDKLSVQRGRLERDQQVVAEGLALLARPSKGSRSLAPVTSERSIEARFTRSAIGGACFFA